MLCLVSLLHHRLEESQMSVWRLMVLLLLVEYLQKTVFLARNSQTEGFASFKFIKLCIVPLIHHRMVVGQMLVWSQMVLLHMVEYLQKTVFWARHSQMEGFVSCKFIYAVPCVIASS